MAIVSCANLLRVISVFHVTLAYYLLTAPSVLVEQNLIIILGAAMDLPLPSESLSTSNSAVGVMALLFLALVVVDMTAPTVESEIGNGYWSNQAPLRVAFYTAIAGGVYFGKFGLEQARAKAKLKGSPQVTSMREALCNSFVFSWAFVEMMLWFWFFTTVREERKEMARKVQEKREAEENRL